MPALLLSTATIDLKPTKTNGLADLGVPVTDATLVKKGKLAEFAQPQEHPRDGGEDDRRRGRVVQAAGRL
jgi:hypothetical protein